ncbi:MULTISPECIES: aminodeoxychorismate/anthranilate synthase component II [unclassified Hydrogenobaculum]|jgi:anthranilate synthase, component II (EC 4.1.3.27)|uniref:anthranilate synthase component II n=1 Tax=unclassified Hydrogenobaculum TaxID=2622382 RepID=UPI0001C51C2C|nr:MULTISPECIES: aminodeoxychorismate/anthranilate synthase component II [unclassified Hydrogenobaculum]AEF19822.1 glutamine amidotransferase of anthranilate synthase [Hydrogenobaculum sp. 3684]AEG47108.1 glutamine amidotransferase of anthranilate synthase [Hydrogenobaculum sp. SHO]AGG15756.1 glutamine amidotransferase of anthranilate synthase [Hydrogenobaculum sp. HO]AGH94056.1 glutamine amidotransferase of anthranilate synthase or aminodeoxychorismate synthase [Hydrogenobaculum sp. SN]
MKLLMIDNYDSFTYNLVQYFNILGQNVEVVKNDEIKPEDIRDMDIDAIVISPGPCSPKEAGISVDVIKMYKDKYPILGVCLGHQSIGYAFGANIVKAKRLMHGKTSMISHDNEGLYKGLPNPFKAVRYHSLVIDKSTLSDEFIVDAVAEDGDIMGIRHKALPIFGVQFHPESIVSEYGFDILKNFLQEAKLSYNKV